MIRCGSRVRGEIIRCLIGILSQGQPPPGPICSRNWLVFLADAWGGGCLGGGGASVAGWGGLVPGLASTSFICSFSHTFIQSTSVGTYCVPSIRDTTVAQTNKAHVLLELTLKEGG